jgi:molybdopterin-binding protein
VPIELSDGTVLTSSITSEAVDELYPSGKGRLAERLGV